MTSSSKKQLDPLFQLFEYYLLHRSYEDAKKFTKELATDYLSYLDSTLAHVPFALRTQVLEDLEAEAHELLVKKMYGCVRAADYWNSGIVAKVREEHAHFAIEFQSFADSEAK